jgi:hypothetical protein
MHLYYIPICVIPAYRQAGVITQLFILRPLIKNPRYSLRHNGE